MNEILLEERLLTFWHVVVGGERKLLGRGTSESFACSCGLHLAKMAAR